MKSWELTGRKGGMGLLHGNIWRQTAITLRGVGHYSRPCICIGPAMGARELAGFQEGCHMECVVFKKKKDFFPQNINIKKKGERKKKT